MAVGLKTGGRKKGTKNKRTIALAHAVNQVVADLESKIGAENVFPGDAHAYLCSVYKDIRQPENFRLDAAKVAVRFEKPQLNHIDAVTETTVRYVARVPEKSDSPETWQERYAPKALLQ